MMFRWNEEFELGWKMKIMQNYKQSRRNISQCQISKIELELK